MTRRMESIFAIIFALVLGGTGLWMGANILLTDRKVKQWPTVAGTVLQRDVVLSETGSVSTPGRRYKAQVRYAYEVDGKAYESDKIVAFGIITGTQEAMQQEVDGLKSPVQVRYNPENPAEACLKSEPAWWAFGALAAGALSLLVGLMTLVSLLGSGKS